MTDQIVPVQLHRDTMLLEIPRPESLATVEGVRLKLLFVEPKDGAVLVYGVPLQDVPTLLSATNPERDIPTQIPCVALQKINGATSFGIAVTYMYGELIGPAATPA